MVPAFQLQGGEARIPETKLELLSMGERVTQVHPEKGRSAAHARTNYSRWRLADRVYGAPYRMPYEPYFACPRRVPRYDVRCVLGLSPPPRPPPGVSIPSPSHCGL